MKRLFLIAVLAAFTTATSLHAAAADLLEKAQRILFLGDSITYGGHYVDEFEAALLLRYPDRAFTIINVGLPSETVSGLSEPGHAGGKFPRPNLHERLDRVLTQTKPDLVFACYGMNDGIYQPFSEERFLAFQAGMLRLHEKVERSGARIVHLTPPVFDPEPIRQKVAPAEAVTSDRPYERYDEEVLTRFTSWLLAQQEEGWTVIDIHKAMAEELSLRRSTDPSYRFAGDGVHPSAAGHRVMAQALLRGCGVAPAEQERGAQWEQLLAAVRQRNRLLTDAWLTACGHQRPQMKQGLPLKEAHAQAATLTQKIEEASAALRKKTGPSD